MKRITLFTLVFVLACGLSRRSCNAEDGTVTGDTRYKFSRSEKVTKSEKAVRPANTRETRNVTPRRKLRSWRSAHWYYSRAAEIPWWPSAPGD